MKRATLGLGLCLALACGGAATGTGGAGADDRRHERGSGGGEPKVAGDPRGEDVPTRPRRDAQIAAILAEHVEPLASAFPAIAVGVYEGGEEYFAGYGHARPGGPPPDDSTLFHVASLTKQHTALLAALLVVEGVLELDAPVVGCKKEVVKALCGTPPTTLRHLLSHTSGLPLAPPDRGGPYPPEKLRAYLERTDLKTSPGDGFQYSTTGYGVIALAIEDHSGEAYEDLLRARVLEPIGSRAVFEMDASGQDRLVQGHRSNGRAAEAGPTSEAFVASGGLIASAGDLLRLIAVHTDPRRKPEWRAAIELTREVQPKVRGFQGSELTAGWHKNARGYYWHLGVSSVNRTTMAYDPAHETGVVILASQSSSIGDSRLEDAASAVLEAIAARTAD